MSKRLLAALSLVGFLFGAHPALAAKSQQQTATKSKTPTKKMPKRPVWSPGPKGSPVQNAHGHAQKHRKEFGHQNSKQYVDATHKFVKNPPKGTQTKSRKNGDKVMYHAPSNTLVVTDKNGTPKTMFKPDPKKHGHKSNQEYFDAQ